jgi:hypothetical protein
MYRLMEIATNHAYETTHFNLRGHSLNPVIHFSPSLSLVKKISSWKIKLLKVLLKDLINEMKGYLFQSSKHRCSGQETEQ